MVVLVVGVFLWEYFFTLTFPISRPITTEEDAIELVKQQFPEVRSIQKAPEGPQIGSSMDIGVKTISDGWKLLFWNGWGDCPAGCLSSHYWYFTVSTDGEVQKVGEYERIFNSKKNRYDETGTPIWDFLN